MDEHPLISQAYLKFSEVGAVASLYELKVRLLADKEAATEAHSTARSVSKTEDAIIKHFSKIGLLSRSEAEILTTAREVRNKFLHGEFPAAISIVERQLGRPIPNSGVTVFKIEGCDDGEEILDQIFAAVEGKTQVTPVRETTIQEGKMLGWFLESYGSGALEAARVFLHSAVKLVDRISLDHALKGQEER